jgi:hypothetical protein
LLWLLGVPLVLILLLSCWASAAKGVYGLRSTVYRVPVKLRLAVDGRPPVP